ncbi:hypothetical protein [Halalkalicoccus subterraneus]|uniref:hypothetical protein n=1 Tax=Halalkalicoccus subterraneus TaxID=2675002 RepID=UPI000EFCA0E0|nr:hypothetical protein [Halalkalicoccus subterraneus]
MGSPLLSTLPSALAPTVWLMEAFVALATGWAGLAIVFVYSLVLGIVVLPLPSELVLLAPIDLGLSKTARLALTVLVSSLGKALGSVLVLRFSISVRESDPVRGRIERVHFRFHEWTRIVSVRMAGRYGYLGMALVLSIPLVPDTASVYAFSVLEDDYLRFSIAAFAGSVARLLVVALLLEGTIGL